MARSSYCSDSAQYLLKHGGIYIRVHPCRMQLDQHDPDVMTPIEEPSLGKNTESNPQNDENQLCKDDEIDEDDSNITEFQPPMTPPATPALDYNHDPAQLQNANLDESLQPANDAEPLDDYPESPPQPEFMTPPEKPAKVPRSLARLFDHNQPGKLEMASDEDAEVVMIACRECSSSSPRFDDAKQQEIQKWRDLGAFVEVDDVGQNSISSRFVCTERLKAGKMNLKARLVARGFEENVNELRTDSPTCQKESLRCFLAILSSKGWKLSTLDIKSAFLQGMPISREVFMKPPKEANTTKLWLLKQCPYGLADAGRLWYLKVRQELLDMGAKQMPTDQAVFVWFDEQSHLSGIMVIHVDDFIYGGSQAFQDSVIARFREIFVIGSEEFSAMRYIGVEVKQESTGILMSTNSYCSDLQEIDTTGLARK